MVYRVVADARLIRSLADNLMPSLSPYGDIANGNIQLKDARNYKII